MDLQGIRSADLTLGGVLKDFYTVPDYQREYVWTTEEVERLLQDIEAEFLEQAEGTGSDYFIGTIVTNVLPNEKVFELIDGQQRITTLYVLLVALRDFLVEIEAEMKGIESQLSDWALHPSGTEERRPRVELQYEDSQDVLARLIEDRSDVPIDELSTDTRSAANIVQAYRDSRAFLAEDLSGDEEVIRRFYAYAIQSVRLIRIETESLDKALWIFETINARGRGLDAMDLLKNLLFQNARSDQFEKLKQRWKAVVDALYEANERPIGFIRYFLLANFSHTRIQADRVYGWLTDTKNPERPDYKSDPVAFTNELLSAARAYVNFAKGKLEGGADSRPLKNMYHLSHTARQHLILLLAARSLPDESIERLATEIENLYCVFLLTGQSANKFEKDFVEWAVELRKMRNPHELNEFLERELIPRRHKLRREFEFALRNLQEHNIPKYRLKYILGKLSQYLDEIAYGPRELDTYIQRRVDIEHILPVGATQEIIEAFGGPVTAAEALHRIGNLTLIERSHNAVGSNKSFPEKQIVYAQSNFLLTKGLGRDVEVGIATQVNKALDYVGTYEAWDEGSFQKREDKLVSLAGRVWDVPTATSE